MDAVRPSVFDRVGECLSLQDFSSLVVKVALPAIAAAGALFAAVEACPLLLFVGLGIGAVSLIDFLICGRDANAEELKALALRVAIALAIVGGIAIGFGLGMLASGFSLSFEGVLFASQLFWDSLVFNGMTASLALGGPIAFGWKILQAGRQIWDRPEEAGKLLALGAAASRIEGVDIFTALQSLWRGLHHLQTYEQPFLSFLKEAVQSDSLNSAEKSAMVARAFPLLLPHEKLFFICRLGERFDQRIFASSLSEEQLNEVLEIRFPDPFPEGVPSLLDWEERISAVEAMAPGEEKGEASALLRSEYRNLCLRTCAFIQDEDADEALLLRERLNELLPRIKEMQRVSEAPDPEAEMLSLPASIAALASQGMRNSDVRHVLTEVLPGFDPHGGSTLFEELARQLEKLGILCKADLEALNILPIELIEKVKERLILLFQAPLSGALEMVEPVRLPQNETSSAFEPLLGRIGKVAAFVMHYLITPCFLLYQLLSRPEGFLVGVFLGLFPFSGIRILASLVGDHFAAPDYSSLSVDRFARQFFVQSSMAFMGRVDQEIGIFPGLFVGARIAEYAGFFYSRFVEWICSR